MKHSRVIEVIKRKRCTQALRARPLLPNSHIPHRLSNR